MTPVRTFLTAASSLALFACTVAPETTSTAVLQASTPAPAAGYGGARGADLSIEAIEPTAEAVRVGQAGDDPADIARYLLALGAGSALISPDGQEVAMAWSVTGVPQIWIAPAAGGQPRQLTFGNGVTFYRWTPDGSGLLYGADNDGDEQPSFNFISRKGGEEGVVLAAVEGGFRSFGDFRPDGSFVYASTERNGLDFDIYIAAAGGEPKRVFEGKYGFFARSVSPGGGKTIVAEAVGEDSDNLFLLDLATGKVETLASPEERANHSDGGFAWSGDGGFYFATNEDREFSALAYRDLDSARTTIVADPGRDVGDVTLCGPGGRYLAWTVNNDGFFALQVRDQTTGKMVPAPTLPDGVYSISCAEDVARMAIRVNGWRTPGDVVVWDIPENKSRTAFTSSLAGLDPERFIKPESIRIKARDGIELQGLLYLPDASSRTGDSLPPVVFDVHGGPTGQSVANFDGVAQYHLDRGVAVFQPNVRGSTGFGRSYTTLDDREKRLDSVRDLVDMLAFLKRDGRVDADRAAVMGGSYGGYMVNAVLAAYPDSFKAGVALFGVSDWVTALEVASPALKASDLIEYGDINEKKWRDFYTINSPIRQADQIKVPVLYSHGAMDPRIDIAETETMVKTLRGNDVEAIFIRMPDEGHGWRKLKNRLFYHRREAEFLAEKLADE